MKNFRITKLNIVESTNYWFWFREAISTLNAAFPEFIREFDSSRKEEWLGGLLFIILLPFLYTVGIWYLPIIYKKQVLELAKDKCFFHINNEKNIEYFTMMSLLSEEDT